MNRGKGGRSSRQYVIWAFKLRGCVDCGYAPRSMDDLRLIHCDHRDPSEKVRFSSRSLKKDQDGVLGASNLELLLEELWKCDPVCVDCHIKRGRERKHARYDQVPPTIKEWIEAGISEDGLTHGEQESFLS